MSGVNGAVDRVTRVCAQHDEERPLRIALVEEIRRTVGFAAYVWALADPETEVGTAPLADVPQLDLNDLPRLIRLRYLTSVNRWNTIEGPANTLLRATGGAPDTSLLYREALAPLGVIDVASLVFRDRHACWGWLARVRLVGGVWLTFRAARVDSDAPTADRDIAVTIEPTTPAERRMLYSRSHALSPREAELLNLLVEGADTKALADALFLSQHTVQDHLKSIFAKTGTRNRRTLLTRVTGR